MSDTASIFDTFDDEAEARAIAKARAELAAGLGVAHDEVVAWLKSWGQEDELPCPVPPAP